MLRLYPHAQETLSHRFNPLAVCCWVLLAFAAATPAARAQSGTKATEPTNVAPVTPAAPATTAGPEADKRGWLFRSALLNIGKPEVKAPEVEFNKEATEEAVAGGQSLLMQPLNRVRDAAKGAVERTRTAWNGAVERMKFRGDGGAPPLFARWFSSEPETPAVAEQPQEILRR